MYLCVVFIRPIWDVIVVSGPLPSAFHPPLSVFRFPSSVLGAINFICEPTAPTDNGSMLLWHSFKDIFMEGRCLSAEYDFFPPAEGKVIFKPPLPLFSKELCTGHTAWTYGVPCKEYTHTDSFRHCPDKIMLFINYPFVFAPLLSLPTSPKNNVFMKNFGVLCVVISSSHTTSIRLLLLYYSKIFQNIIMRTFGLLLLFHIPFIILSRVCPYFPSHCH